MPIINNPNKKKLDEILGKLHYLEMVIRNLKERHDSYFLDVEGVDESLFQEIANYEMLTEEMKSIFLELLIDDARSIASRALQGSDFHEKACEMLDGIGRMLDSLYEHEKVDIGRSEALKETAVKAKQELHRIRSEMERGLRPIENEKKKKSKTQYIRTGN